MSVVAVGFIAVRNSGSHHKDNAILLLHLPGHSWKSLNHSDCVVKNCAGQGEWGKP
jgi:hypothetical protein